MNNGWLKIFRKIKKWKWYQKSEMVHLFLHFIFSANHEDKEWQGQTIKRGQFITGRNKLNTETGISAQTIRTCINRLKSTNEITSKSTNKFTIITVINYDKYQLDIKKSTSKITSKLTNHQPTTNQQLTTNKNDKNDKNDKNNEKDNPVASAKPPQIDVSSSYKKKKTLEIISKFVEKVELDYSFKPETDKSDFKRIYELLERYTEQDLLNIMDFYFNCDKYENNKFAKRPRVAFSADTINKWKQD